MQNIHKPLRKLYRKFYDFLHRTLPPPCQGCDDDYATTLYCYECMELHENHEYETGFSQGADHAIDSLRMDDDVDSL